MNLLQLTDNDIILMDRYIRGVEIPEDQLAELKNKLSYTVDQIDARTRYLDYVERLNNEYKEKLSQSERAVEDELEEKEDK